MKDVKYKLDKHLKEPLYIQLYNHFKKDILSGNISDNERLPSRRNLSQTLGLSKNTVELAYQKLVDEGYAVSHSRSGYYARQSSPLNADISEPDFYDTTGIIYTMSQNGVDAGLIPKDAITKIYREFIYDIGDLLPFGHKYGETKLRKAISHLLYELHGVSAAADRIIIGAGSDYLLQQLTHVLGPDAVIGFENPPFARSYIPVKNSGRRVELINTGMDFFPMAELHASDINVMYVSPCCQFPTARQLSKEQRAELLSWADAGPDRYIIEADFDADFSVKSSPGPLLAENAEKVIYLGGFSRTVIPSFKTSYIVLPEKLKEKFNERLPYYTNLSSRLEQQVIAGYIQSGKYQRHTERLERVYAEKQQTLLNALKSSAIAPHLTLYSGGSGTFIVLAVNNGMTEAELRSSAAENGVKIIPLSLCSISYNKYIPKNSFILGYGELKQNEITDAVSHLVKAWSPAAQ